MGEFLQLNESEEALFGVSPPMGLRRRILGCSTLRWLDRNAKHLDINLTGGTFLAAAAS